jgi:hypothetical protein
MSFIETEAEFIKQEATFIHGAIAAVRIENTTDEAFWTTVFSTTIPYKKVAFYPYSNIPTPNTTGKISVLRYAPFADAQLWLCIDSDYDYLRQLPELNNRFVIQTYVYAVENYRCYAPSLTKILQNTVALPNKTVDFKPFFADYSKIIYELLICSILAEDTEGVAFSANDCAHIVELPQHFEESTTVLAHLKIKVEAKLSALKSTFSIIFDAKKEVFERLGLTESNAYLFLQCHKLLDNVAKPLLDHYFNKLKKQHIETLKEMSDDTDRKRELRTYTSQLSNTKLALLDNTDFQDCPFFLKIQSDIRRLVV